jgi:hypothetical protein
LGVLSGGGPFWVPFWASKKVQNIKEDDNSFNQRAFLIAQRDKII